jgi:hypothetical protein
VTTARLAGVAGKRESPGGLFEAHERVGLAPGPAAAG